MKSENPATAQNPTRQRASNELRAVALEQFSTVGFAGTSLQQIADAAGYSKSSVLYHFASKEALLDEVLTPAIDRLEEIVEYLASDAGTAQSRREFIDEFIDFLLEFRLEVNTFINQGQSLRGIGVIDRAGALILRLTGALRGDDTSTIDGIRFGMALGGAAYTLVAGATYFPDQVSPEAEVRQALQSVVTELLAPVPLRRPTEGK